MSQTPQAAPTSDTGEAPGVDYDGAYPGIEDHGPLEVENDDLATDEPDVPEDEVVTDDVDMDVDILSDAAHDGDEGGEAPEPEPTDAGEEG